MRLVVVIVLLNIFQTCFGQKIKLQDDPNKQQVKVLVSGEIFTVFRYSSDYEKPILYPVKTANGNTITRGFPIDTRKNERIDHPHQVGVWFNYGDVSGIDFWNNSKAIPSERKGKYGRITLKKLLKVTSGESGELKYEAYWTDKNNTKLLREETSMVFSEKGKIRFIDRITKLTAESQDIFFNDSKEGLFGIRVRRELELPSLKPATFTNDLGLPNTFKKIDNEIVTGNYISSEGLQGNNVWSCRAKWVMLQGDIQGNGITIAIIDHPDNVGYPTHWMARGYGLFAANPLGQKVFTKGKKELNFKLMQGESVVFKYRMIIHSGKHLSTKEIENSFLDFASEI
ncbi:PmoA family protein [Marinifilum caeruleilacunae]|uniref:Methane oxygenase PmoA n=1 Tax=Marinifilum caeruleilacunae TaxID=2499076 RepID=A0ABX1WZH8_9BACT|nr:PmoA family protein [Marinifilum caeruleilacunae]NOU61306.1 hypothetical protein [Marinifilum caeruleilacunae]